MKTKISISINEALYNWITKNSGKKPSAFFEDLGQDFKRDAMVRLDSNPIAKLKYELQDINKKIGMHHKNIEILKEEAKTKQLLLEKEQGTISFIDVKQLKELKERANQVSKVDTSQRVKVKEMFGYAPLTKEKSPDGTIKGINMDPPKSDIVQEIEKETLSSIKIENKNI